MNRGYIKLWRKSKESAVFAHEGLWKLWSLCLMKGTHQRIEVTISGILKPLKLNSGQFVTGRYSLHYDYHQGDKKRKYSRKTAPTPYTLIRWLLILQEMQMLSIKTFNKYSIITILNWHLYQENPSQTLDTRELSTSLTAKQAMSANSEHQKKIKNTDILNSSDGVGFKDEHQVSNRRASSEHKQTQYKHNKRIAHDLYEFYLKEISPKNKSRQRAISNITSYLKKYQNEQLVSAIKNYKTNCVERDPLYRKDPANFFGKREHYFIDFLPENFKASACDQSLVQRKKQPSIEELLSND